MRGSAVLTGTQRTASGRRTARVTIQQITEAEGESGATIATWTDLKPSEWMNRMDVRADERFAANQEAAFTETVWQMPYRRDMDPDLVDVPKVRRLVYSGRAYDIRSAVRLGRMAIEIHSLAGSRLPQVVA